MVTNIVGEPALEAKRLEFEVLISDFSARFVNVPAGLVDREIEDALCRVLSFFDVDRCGLLEVHDYPKEVRLTHACMADGIPTAPVKIDYIHHFPWMADRLLNHVEILNSHTRELPPDAVVDRASAEAIGIKTFLTIPLLYDGAVRYLIAINAVREERVWPAEYIPRVRLVGEIFVNALMRDRAYRFETLLSDISPRFVNLPSGKIDRVIEETQVRICECLGIDRSSFWQIPEAGQPALKLTNFYQASNTPLLPESPDASDLFPWVVSRIRTGETVLISKLEDLPPEAAADKGNFRRYGTRSAAVFPLRAGGTFLGAISFAFVREEREWPENLVVRLRLVAQIYANALARKRGDQDLREGREIFKTVFQSVVDKVIVADKGGNVIVVNEPRTASFQESPAEILKVSAGENYFEVCRRLAEAGDPAAGTVLSGIRAALEGSPRFSTEYFPDPSKTAPCYLVDVTPWLPDRGVVVVFNDITDLKATQGELRRALEDVTRLREESERENLYLRQELSSLVSPKGIVGQSEAIRRVLGQAKMVAATGSAVLLLGETGTGKGRIASFIHENSSRRDRPMVSVNCAAIPETLIESELFGREKGAYTGAYARKAGSFEFANGSTLFLDEVGELPPEAQAKLLRVLEEKKINRLGSPRDIAVDVRIVAASNRDLGKEVREGRFRSDLYYRLNVFTIVVPPLRERREDISIMVESFAREFGEAMGKAFRSVPRSDLEKLAHYHWPGNIRELRNVVERAAILSPGPNLRVELPVSDSTAPARVLTMGDAEREHIRSVLEMTGWQVGGKGGAAGILGMKPSTLRSRMAKLGVHRSGGPRDIAP